VSNDVWHNTCVRQMWRLAHVHTPLPSRRAVCESVPRQLPPSESTRTERGAVRGYWGRETLKVEHAVDGEHGAVVAEELEVLDSR